MRLRSKGEFLVCHIQKFKLEMKILIFFFQFKNMDRACQSLVFGSVHFYPLLTFFFLALTANINIREAIEIDLLCLGNKFNNVKYTLFWFYYSFHLFYWLTKRKTKNISLVLFTLVIFYLFYYWNIKLLNTRNYFDPFSKGKE